MITTDTTNKFGTTVAKDLHTVSARLMEADAETLWAEIRELARNYDYPFAARILEVGEHEHWTVTHVALALAHAHMGSNNHGQDLQRDDGVHESPDHHEQALSGQTSIWLDGSIRDRAWVRAADFRE
jgi:hypothetical protein